MGHRTAHTPPSLSAFTTERYGTSYLQLQALRNTAGEATQSHTHTYTLTDTQSRLPPTGVVPLGGATAGAILSMDNLSGCHPVTTSRRDINCQKQYPNN